MNIPSLVRSLRKKFFGGATPRRKPFRRSRGLQVEALEARDVPAVLPPVIAAVSPPNFSTFPGANPTLQITFSEAMNANDVKTVANYALYNSSGAQVPINSVAYNPATFTATVNYNNGNTLIGGTYTLFVKGDHIHDAANAFTISPPGQLVTADLKHGTVSTLNAFPTGNGNLYGAPQSYPLLTSESAVAVTVADFNNDGLNDIAVADKKNDKVYVFLGRSNGGFDTIPDATLNLPTGALSKAPGGVPADILTTGHVAGTALTDLVVADPGTNQVTIFLNQTTASGLAFSSGAGTTYIAGNDPVGVAVGDFLGNGKLEVAAADGAADTQGFFDVTVLTNNSGGTFSGTATFHTKLANLTGIAAGNLSGAAGPDLVVSGDNGLEALLNVSTANTVIFDTSSPAFGGGASFGSVALGDLTSAGATQLDVGAITTGASGNNFEAFANQGGGASFSNKATVPLAGPATSLVLQDLNGDGLADPVLASPGSNAVTVLVNTTSGSVTFSGPTNYQVDNGPDAVAVADLNGDGNPDIVSANNVAPSFSTLLGNGDGTFAVPTTVTEAGTPNPSAIAVGDLNGDGLNDYVVVDSNTNQVEVYLATAPGVYAPPVAYSVVDGSGHGLKPVGVTLANLTGKFYADGLPILDIVTADATPDGTGKYYISVLPNKGDGSGTYGAARTFAVGQSPTAVAAGLFRTVGGKQAQDLIVAHNGSGTTPLARGVTELINTTPAAGPISFAPGTEIATPANVAVSFAPTALAVGDFNADGKQDFVVLNSSIAPSIDLYDGNGGGGFTKVGSFALNQNLTPSALAVGDLNNDGYLDVAVVASKTADLGHAVIESLINTLGGGPNTTGSLGGFGNVVLSPGLPYGVTGNSVALVHTEDSPFPSLVLGTVATTSKSAPALTVSNLFVLRGAGDGKFLSPVPYEVAGEPTSTSVAVTSDPMMPVVTFFKTGQLVTTDLIVNGDFDKTELNGETGNLDGWQTASLKDSFGQWAVMQAQAGVPLSPLSRTPVANPPAGLQFEAMLDEWNIVPSDGFFGYGPDSVVGGSDTAATFAGSNFLYQDITIPASATSANLTLTLFLKNTAGAWFNGNPSDPLNYNLPDTKDQQVAVDIVDPTQNVTFAPSQLSIFDTTSTTPLVTTLNLSGNLIAFRGKTIRLRIAGVDNQGLLIVGVDNVHLQTTFTDTTPPTLSNLRVRNPGQTVTIGTLQNVAVTTDPTIVGRVGDSGGVNAVAFVEVDPNNAGFLASNVIRINPSQFDAQGNFQVTLPNLSAGLHIIGVRVHGVSGLTFTLTLPMIFQGLSNSTVQAVGPSGNTGGISTAGTPDVLYSSVSGRITATAADPTDLSGNTIYAGSQNGGVWKSTDGGANWTPLTDFVSDQSGNPINVPVGAIAVAKTSPKTVYVATGDGNDLPDTLGGIGVLKSLDGGVTWAVVGNSPTVLANARVTAMAVDPNNANTVYVAVASGGQGPGVYRTLDGGQTWTNILSTSNMAAWGKSGTTVAAFDSSIQLGSVTSLVLDPFNTNQVVIGIGNIGMLGSGAANASPTAGVWISANANSPSGVSWTSVLGGNDTRFVGTTNNVPSPTNFLPGGPTTGLSFSQWPGLTADPAGNGTQLGRVTVAEGFGRGPNQATFYVLMGSVATSTPPLTGGNVNFGNGTQFGLYKSSDGGLNWTHVRLRDQTGFQVDGNGVASPIYSNLNLLGKDAANGASMVVDKTDPNVIYIGGTVAYDPTDHAAHGMIEVDTGDMLDATDDGFLAAQLIVQEDHAWGGTLALSDILNDSDSIQKAWTAYDGTFKDVYDIAALGGSGAFHYDADGNIFEGVSWFDIATNEYDPYFGLDPNFGENWGISGQLPSEVLSLTVDPQGRILVGTEKGLFRIVNRGIGYDYTTGGLGNLPGGPAAWVGFEGIMAEGAILGITTTGAPPPANATVTNLNANLQVTDVTSVAVDPYLAGVYYIGTQGSGTARTASPGSLNWQTMGLTGPIGQTTSTTGPVLAPVGANGVEDASAVLVGAQDPNAPPGTPATVYAHYAYLFGKDFVPLFSTQGGELGTFQEKFAGIDTTDAGGYLPLMAIDPTKILDNGQYQDELIYGTDQVYSTRTNSDLWLNLDGGHPLADPGQLISAAAIAPSNSDFIYVGTSNGKVFVTQSSGADFWPEKDSGLPSAPVSGFAVNPTNPLIAYVTFSGFGAFPHMWATSNGGTTWTSIQGNLPMVQVFSFVTDPRPAAGAPNGFLYAGTQVGLFDSTDGGKTWNKLGQGLPNVPVVSMNFNAGTNQLVIGTQGRGVFVISTDRVGPSVVSVSPSQPVNIGTVNSITVTFNEPILDSSFTTAQVKITGPGGINIPVTSVTDISVTPLGQTNPHNVFQVLFPTLTLDGGYTITIGPNITDLTGNPMDQNHNLINGQPGVAPVGDAFQFQLAVNTTDDGRFISGLVNDILGHPASSNAFLTYLPGIDAGRAAAVANMAAAYVMAARGQLVTSLFSSAATPASSLGIGNLSGSTITPADVNFWVGQLRAGVPVETLIDAIVSNAPYFTQTRAGHNVNGNDSNWVTQLFLDLLGRNPSPAELSGDVGRLQSAEAAARKQLTTSLIASQAYLTQYITQGAGPFQGTLDYAQGYLGILGRAPSPTELANWIKAFQAGASDGTFIATLMGTAEFFNRAPSIVHFFAPLDPDGTGAPSLRAFVKAAYYELFPNSTPPVSLVNSLVAQMQAGKLTQAQVAANLMSMDQFLFDPANGLIAQYYSFYLGRVATPAEINAWRPFFAAGGRIEGVLATLVASPEYFNNHSPAGTPLATMDANWLKAAYDQLTGFDPTSGQQSSGLAALAAAEQAARLAVAQGITASGEYRQHLVKLLYSEVLHRAPSPTELVNGVNLLSLPPSGPGTLSRDEQLLADLLGSHEYFFDQSDPTGLHTNIAWVDSLYPVLQLPFDPNGAAASVNTLLSLYAPQRLAVINALLSSTEYRTNLIKQAFTFLGRPPSSSDITTWLQNLAAGMTYEQMVATLMGTPEYFAHAPSVVGLVNPSNDAFVRAVFKQLIPFANITDTDVNFWVNQIQRGLITRTAFALRIITSPTYRFDATNGLVNQLYLKYLDRSATAQDNQNAARLFAAGGTDEQLIASLLVSPEYFERTHPFP